MADNRRRIPVRGRLLDEDDEDDLVGPRTGGTRAARDDEDDDLVGPRTGGTRSARGREDELAGPRTGGTRGPRRSARGGARPAPRPRRAPARRGGGDRAWLRSLLRDIPSFLKLLWGLARDPRVSKADKAIVVATLAYAALPADVIPDWIPGLGEVEDVLLVALALYRLLSHAGEEVLLDHWEGDEETLETALEALETASEYLPGPIRGLIGGRR
jgi:uncharacterized membrane protein YkvA (DUF1232 family)